MEKLLRFATLGTMPMKKFCSILFILPIICAQVALAEFESLQTFFGEHIKLTTDLDSEIDSSLAQIPREFDSAVREWFQLFRVKDEIKETWRAEAFLIGDARNWEKTPQCDAIANLRHGFARGNEIFVREQPQRYYRGHLLRHEAAHLFLQQLVLQSRGAPQNSSSTQILPAWYHEGMAEFLATGKTIPTQRENVPQWRHIDLIQNALRADQVRSIDEIFAFSFADFERDDQKPYAWSWALVYFLASQKNDIIFTAPNCGIEKMLEEIGWNDTKTRAEISLAWCAFISDLDYGATGESMQITRAAKIENQESIAKTEIEIDAAQSWQDTGIILVRGTQYRITATGEFSLGGTPEHLSQANGITIRYVGDMPLGTLQAAVIPEDCFEISTSAKESTQEIATRFSATCRIGNELLWREKQGGKLFLRLADFPNARSDNHGKCRVICEECVEEKQ